jgi:hypothetical protein
MRHRYIYVNGELVEVTADYRPESRQTSWQTMPDIKPYRSMIDGRVINSRSVHREHLREHGCVEIGNDSSLRGQPKPIQAPPGLKDAILRSYHEVVESKRR